MAHNTAPLPGLADPNELSGDRQFSINLSRGLQVLRAFTPSDATLSHRDLCERTGLAKATVSRITHTLTMLGYMVRTNEQRYALGAGVLSLGYPMLAGMRIRQLARPWLERLAGETGGTANLGMRDRLNVVYVDSCRADRSNVFRPDIGTTAPLLATSIGRALLLGSPASERTAVLNRLRVAAPDRFEADRAFWEADRDAFAERRYCLSRGDWRPGVHAVAMPLRQRLQAETMAVNCTWAEEPGGRHHDAREIAGKLLETIRRIERACLDET